MTRHARNSTAGTVYTYHERKKDAQQSGYGSDSRRFGKDSVKEFDCCCLTLQPCRDPMITPEGHVYDKESILEYIIHQKREIARRMKEFEKQKTKQDKEKAVIANSESETKKQNFFNRETNPVGKNISDAQKPGTSRETEKSISNMQNGQDKKLPSFWLPSMTPDAGAEIVKKPDEKVRCPMSGKALKLKDLIPIHFTPIKDGDKKTSLITKQARYVCAVTNDVLGNSVPCAALRTSGSVVTMECVEKLIKKDMLDPINGKQMTQKDIIPLERGASGFAGSGVNLEGKKDRPSLQA